MDVHPPKNGINRYWSIAIWKDKRQDKRDQTSDPPLCGSLPTLGWRCHGCHGCHVRRGRAGHPTFFIQIHMINLWYLINIYIYIIWYIYICIVYIMVCIYIAYIYIDKSIIDRRCSATFCNWALSDLSGCSTHPAILTSWADSSVSWLCDANSSGHGRKFREVSICSRGGGSGRLWQFSASVVAGQLSCHSGSDVLNHEMEGINLFAGKTWQNHISGRGV